MNIELMYNPYFCSTKLCIDGAEYKNPSARLHAYMNMPLEKWLEDTNESYKSWNGFFVELIDEVNDDEINITFFSDEKYFDIVEQSFERQKYGIVQKGFLAEKIALSLVNIYEQNTLKDRLCAFVQRYMKSCKMQAYMEKMTFIHKDCQKLDRESNYFEMYERILSALEFAKEKAIDKQYWDDSVAELKQVFEGKGVK